MAKNIKSIFIKQNWNSFSLPSGLFNHPSDDISKDLFIRSLIHGSFFKLGILTSHIKISSNCLGSYIIQFLYYPLSPKISPDLNHQNFIIPLLNILKLTLNLKYPKFKFKFVCIKAPHKFCDSKILNDFIHVNLADDPNKFKFIFSNLIRDYRKLFHKI